MSTLRTLAGRLFGAGLVDWLAAGRDSGGTRLSQDRTAAIASPRLAAEDASELRLTDREREIELRVLMSNWM